MADHPDVATILANRPNSVGRMFFERVEATPNGEAYRFPRGEVWESVTWAETGDHVTKLAAGLIALGVQAEQRVAIAAGTRYEWVLADLAIMSAGAATTTVYPSSMADDVAYIVGNSDSHVVFAEDDVQIEKLRSQRDSLPALSRVVTFDGTTGRRLGDHPRRPGEARRGVAGRPGRCRHRADRCHHRRQPGHVDLHVGHHRPAERRARSPQVVDLRGRRRAGARTSCSSTDLQYLWLPLAHSFGKVLLTTQLAIGFPTAIDGRVDKIIDNLAVVKPTFMGAAPRIFEKAHGRIVTMVAAEGGLRRRPSSTARSRSGSRCSAASAPVESVPPLLAVQQALFDRLVFAKIRARFGGRLRFFVSGAAALNRELAEWFMAAGVVVLEGYGLTETSAGSTVNRPWDVKFGTVGPPFPGTEFKIAEDGEILINGPGVMEGYHNDADATAEALIDGWFHTGDIGEIDADGFVRITDRKKDLFKTSGGKYIAPQMIEGQFKAVCPYASQIVVHGNERNFVSAIITLDPDSIVGWAEQHGLARRRTPRSSAPTPRARWCRATSTSSTAS